MAVRTGASEHPLVRLARAAVEAFVRNDRTVEPADLPSDLPDRAGVFVTIRKDGELRGCIGTIEPVCESLAEETIRSAILAATDDPRFPTVAVAELALLSYSVSILDTLELTSGLDDLDPAVFGVVVRSGHRRGLLLPGIAGIDSAEAQVTVARRKAGIPAGAEIELYRFRTRHFE